MNTYENLTILRNIFYKSFLIGLIFLTLAGLIYLPCRCVVANIYQSNLQINLELYNKMWISFIGSIKTIIIFFFLVPGLAVHWVSRSYK